MTKEKKLIQNLTDLPAWQQLKKHQKTLANQNMRDWFSADNQRFARYSLHLDEIFFDYSRHRIQDTTLTLLCDLALACDLQKKIAELFSGATLNFTEKRPALHSALRNQN